ncbi:DUF898 family protein [Alphaproteobacteria bacterium KMM 3653]|uniref:DUF898 family protein n=1 Tax=Harenicola maris TaxID=2841044 RepID=A0AAP2CTX3_9RHOB|nr:DUF898 family protein [Harenicola maris]
MTDFSTDPRDDRIQGEYRGEGGKAFWLVFLTGFLTIITLGIYRFWAKTRIRRYLWSSTAPGGDPFEYTGTGLEKLLGFLVAIVVLAVYLGVLQLVLFAAGLSFLSGLETMDEVALLLAVYIPLIALMPLVFYAQYRGRRYMLSRTRWRGVRFAAEKGAFGYMFRALGYYILAALTLGILTPLATFKLEKYRIDRTWYGDAKFVQGGRWTMLYKAMLHIFIAIAMFVLAIALMVNGTELLGAVLMFVAYIWFFFGSIYYNVHAHRILAATKVLGETIRFQSLPRTGNIIGTYILGSIAVALIMTIAAIPLGGILIGMLGGMDALVSGDFASDPTAMFAVGIIAILAYVAFFLLAGALSMVFITQPILRHYVEETAALNTAELNTIRQRAGDDQMDAEGFADALDIGAAF